jgi:hypothetical protein
MVVVDYFAKDRTNGCEKGLTFLVSLLLILKSFVLEFTCKILFRPWRDSRLTKLPKARIVTSLGGSGP